MTPRRKGCFGQFRVMQNVGVKVPGRFRFARLFAVGVLFGHFYVFLHLRMV